MRLRSVLNLNCSFKIKNKIKEEAGLVLKGIPRPTKTVFPFPLWINHHQAKPNQLGDEGNFFSGSP
jgi:hypothetical protein